MMEWSEVALWLCVGVFVLGMFYLIFGAILDYTHNDREDW